MVQSLWSFLHPRHTLIIWSSKLPKGHEHLGSHKNLHVSIYSSWFIIAKAWKQPKCLSAGEWIHKLKYIRTREYYSTLKRHVLSGPEKTWRIPKCILISERSQSEKSQYGIYSYMTSWKRQNGRDSKKINGCLGLGWRRMTRWTEGF